MVAQSRPWRPLATVGFCLGLFTSAFAVRLALTLPWTDSEIWSVSSLSLWGATIDQLSVEMKPAFSFFVWLLARGQPLEEAMDVTRIAVSLLIPVNLVLAAVVIRKAGAAGSVAIAAASWIFLHPETLTQFVAVRSDIVAFPLVLALVLALLQSQTLIACSAAAAALAVTPKAALMGLAVLWLTRRRAPIALGSTLITGLIALVLANPQARSFAQAILSQQTGLAGHWEYVWLWIYSGPSHFAVLLISSGLALFAGQRGESPHRSFRAAGLSVIALVLIFPERLPFFVASALSVAQVLLFAGLLPLLGKWRPSQKRRFAAVTLSLLIAAGVFLVVQSERSIGTSIQPLQRSATQSLREFLIQHPNLSIYDPIGLVPRPDMSLHFLGPGQVEHNRRLPEVLKRDRFDLIIVTEKVQLVMPALYPYIKDRFVLWPGGVLTRGFRVPVAGLNSYRIQDLAEPLQTHWPQAYTASARVHVRAIDDKGLDARSRVVIAGPNRRVRADDTPVSVIDFLRDFETIELDGRTVELGFSLVPPAPDMGVDYTQLFAFPKPSN